MKQNSSTTTAVKTAPTASKKRSTKAATQPCNATQKKLLEKHFPLVQTVVRGMMNSLPPCADFEELHSVGVIGLVSAVRNFRKDRAETFEAYAALRIRGAILDELRRIDRLPRASRQKNRLLNQTVIDLEQELGRAPDDDEIANRLGLNQKDYDRFRQRARPIIHVSLDHRQTSDDEPDSGRALHDIFSDQNEKPSSEKVEREELARLVASEIRNLPERQQKVLAFYYFEGMRLAEIAAIFGVTEARICQIHIQALSRIRRALKKYD
ncbi:MAG: FliA/WhiG family RNA polymerase sigma factor [Opitutales bacterium]